ncbi:MAG: glycosyltransferase family 9 protein [Nitrospirae bacterium]|nr:MAG: glycosyltransferase family 9 protein [Nitrospirota bacterium]
MIKMTSLGDVLHATGHIRTIKENYPHSHLTLLTADTSYDIFKYNPYVDRILLFEKDRVKRQWRRDARWAAGHVLSLIREVSRTHFDLAFDLQGRFKSVVFLYAADASQKYVKGRWWFVKHFRKPEIHAIAEMDRVLQMAGLHVANSAMEIRTSSAEQKTIDALLERINPTGKKMMIVSPFTRWKTKNWGVEKFHALFQQFPFDLVVIFTGSRDQRHDIAELMAAIRYPFKVNLAGSLTLLEFAELMKRVDVVVTGDSFPMHLASAVHTPVVALFGPTDETRIGPVDKHAIVLRAEETCRRCYRRDQCERNCINAIAPETVLAAIQQQLGLGEKTPVR